MSRQILGQIIEYVRIPRRLVHIIHRLDQAAADQLGPEAIDDRSRQSAIGSTGDELLELLQSLRLV